MKTIFKYELKGICHSSLVEPVMMPHNAKFLHVDTQGDHIFLWAEVDTESSLIECNFEVFGTGHEMNEDMGIYRVHIGTVMMSDGALVFHVYQRVN